MPWHPPIPAGKLYTAPALQLGSGLALLLWCYDGIQRSGEIEVRLDRAAAEMGISYRVLKDWWRLLRDGPFFCEQFDRGKRGWMVRMADDWIDWRVLRNNYPVTAVEGQNSALQAPPSSPDEGQNSALDGGQVPVKSRSSPDEGQNSALDDRVYKEDQHDQESRERGARKRAVSRAPPKLESVHEGVTTYRRLTGKRTVAPTVATQIAEKITDLPLWEKVITAWCGKYRPENVSGMLDWYEHPEKIHSNGTLQPKQRNGRHPDPRDEWPGFTAWDHDKPL